MAVYGSNYAYGASPLYMDDGVLAPTIDANVNILIDDIIIDGLVPTIIVTSQITMDFIGIPQIGSSPLIVNFSATTNLQGGIDGSYLVSAYDWYFDNDSFPNIYEETSIPFATHTYIGYSGKRYSVKLVGKIVQST